MNCQPMHEYLKDYIPHSSYFHLQHKADYLNFFEVSRQALLVSPSICGYLVVLLLLPQYLPEQPQALTKANTTSPFKF